MAAASKLACCSSRETPWPTIWKKPVVRQADRTALTISSAAADEVLARYEAMSIVGTSPDADGVAMAEGILMCFKQCNVELNSSRQSKAGDISSRHTFS